MRYVGLLAGIGLLLAVTATAGATTTVVEGITGAPGDWTYTYTLTNGETLDIWEWAVWFPSNPVADAVTAGTANWAATNLATHGFFPEEYTASWGGHVYDSLGADLAGPKGEPGFYYTYASDYTSGNPGQYWDGDSWESLPDPGDAFYRWRGEDYGWDGSGAKITTSYGIASGATSTFTVHATNLIAGPKSFSFNTTDYWYSYYDGTDDHLDFEGSGTVIPEPVTMAGLMLGISCLARYVRRRKV